MSSVCVFLFLNLINKPQKPTFESKYRFLFIAFIVLTRWKNKLLPENRGLTQQYKRSLSFAHNLSPSGQFFSNDFSLMIIVDEARGVRKHRSRWRSIVFAYPHGIKAWHYVCWHWLSLKIHNRQRLLFLTLKSRHCHDIRIISFTTNLGS